jgi:hypothetical protein
MRLRESVLPGISFAALLLCQPTPLLAQPEVSPDLTEVETIMVTRTDGQLLPFRFNSGRPFVVSINSGVPGARAARGAFVSILARNRLLDKVVFEWFGPKTPETLEIEIGSKVPVEMAQAAVRLFCRRVDMPVVISVDTEDGVFGNTQRIYIGGLVASGKPPTNRDRIDALLREGISQEDFLAIASGLK